MGDATNARQRARWRIDLLALPHTPGRDEPTPTDRRGIDRVALALMALAAVWAVAGSLLLFPHGSSDLDEPVYLLQADALAHGHLFPQVPVRHPEAYRPWLGVIRDHHVVLKYTPVHAAFLAVAQRFTGTPRAALPVFAAALIGLTYLLAAEITERRRPARVAAALVLGSPMFLALSATYLSYVMVLCCLVGGTWLWLVGMRGRGWLVRAGAGLAFGVAFFARPYDALLFGVPVVAALSWQAYRRDGWRHLVMRAVPVAVGSLPPLAGLLAYDRAATGSALRNPFSRFDRLDTVGFGSKRIAPWATVHHFGPVQGITGILSSLANLGLWGAGGPFLLVLAFLGWRRWRLNPDNRRWLGWLIVTFGVGYTVFWGPWYLHLHWSRVFLGPFYVFPLLIPLAVFAATVADRRRPLMAVAGVTVLLVAVMAVRDHSKVQAIDAAARPLAAVRAASALVLVDSGQPTLQNPLARTANIDGYSGRTVFAVAAGDGNFGLVDDWKGRDAYLFRVRGRVRVAPDTALDHLDRVAGSSVPVQVNVPASSARGYRGLRVGAAEYPLSGAELHVVVAISPTGAIVLGLAPAPSTGSAAGRSQGSGGIVLALVAGPSRETATVVDQVNLAARRDGSSAAQVEVLVPDTLAVSSASGRPMLTFGPRFNPPA